MVSSMSEAGETMFSVCSAWVNQLMKSCSELWKSVASVKASSSFTYKTKHHWIREHKQSRCLCYNPNRAEGYRDYVMSHAFHCH